MKMLDPSLNRSRPLPEVPMVRKTYFFFLVFFFPFLFEVDCSKALLTHKNKPRSQNFFSFLFFPPSHYTVGGGRRTIGNIARPLCLAWRSRHFHRPALLLQRSHRSNPQHPRGDSEWQPGKSVRGCWPADAAGVATGQGPAAEASAAEAQGRRIYHSVLKRCVFGNMKIIFFSTPSLNVFIFFFSFSLLASF